MRATRVGAGSAADPMVLLALRVVRQAVQDARAGRAEAAAWLRSDNPILEHFDITAERVEAALRRPKRWARKAKPAQKADKPERLTR